MSRRNNWAHDIVSERYLVWAVVLIVTVAVALLAQISFTKIQFDNDAGGVDYPLHHK